MGSSFLDFLSFIVVIHCTSHRKQQQFIYFVKVQREVDSDCVCAAFIVQMIQCNWNAARLAMIAKSSFLRKYHIARGIHIDRRYGYNSLFAEHQGI